LTVAFTDASANSPTSWYWTFGDGSTSTLKSPSHTYSIAGTYTVSLKATNSAGSNTLTRTGYITASTVVTPPVTSFTGAPTSGSTPLTVAFTDTSSNSPTTWYWTFGDGYTSTAKSPSHTYSVKGTYTVSLKATNAGGSNTLTRTGYVTIAAAPVASFTGTPTSGSTPLTVAFTDTSSNTPTSWYWTFGDGGISTLQNPSHTYNTAGTYTVTLRATNAGGGNTLTRTGYITAGTVVTPPVAGFTGTLASGKSPLTVAFTDASSNTPTSWYWTFGDGYTSTLQNPSHTYSAKGTYTVSLRATNAGGSDTLTRNRYIKVVK
jgi:PKD repeat protein